MNEDEMDSITSTLNDIKLIDGIAVGAGGTPGCFFSVMMKLFSMPPPVALKLVESIGTPVGRLAFFLYKIKLQQDTTLPVPWDLLLDTTITYCAPFGCNVSTTTLGSVTWEHMIDRNFLGLFHDEVETIENKELGSIHFVPWPVYPEIQLKRLAFTLLCTPASTSYTWKIMNWLDGMEDIFGRLTFEREDLLAEWKAAPLSLSNVQIWMIIGRICKDRADVETYQQILIDEYSSSLVPEEKLAILSALLYNPSELAREFLTRQLPERDQRFMKEAYDKLGLTDELVHDPLFVLDIGDVMEHGNEDETLDMLVSQFTTGHAIIINKLQDIIKNLPFTKLPGFGKKITMAIKAFWNRHAEFMEPWNCLNDCACRLDFLLNGGFSRYFEATWDDIDFE
nr:hypothetical protein [Candidatus Sigynarchaeota archaeon]